MTVKISHIPFYARVPIADWKLLVAGLAYAVPVALAFLFKPILGVILASLPFIFLIINNGRWGIYLLIASSFLFYPMTFGVTILHSDIAAFILVAAYLIDFLVSGRTFKSNHLVFIYVILLAVSFISIALEGFTPLSLRYFSRQLFLFLTFMAVAHFANRISIRHIFILFVSAAVLNSSYSLIQFLGGGSRSFGLAGHGYGDHVMLAFLIATGLFLFARDLRARIIWGLCLLIVSGGLAATQTRASAITAAWGLVVLIFISFRTARQTGLKTPQKNITWAAIFFLMAMPILATYTPVFEGIVARFERFGFHATGTILLRWVLWKAAWAAFLKNPVFGIGAGNFAEVYRWVPEVKFDHVFYLVTGLSTHLVALAALAETGLTGFIALIALLGSVVKKSYQSFSSALTEREAVDRLILFVIALVITGSSFYAGSWFWGNNSYHMALFFGLIASHQLNHEAEKRSNWYDGQ